MASVSFSFLVFSYGHLHRHYFQPMTPVVPGIEAFCGNVLHSHDYREPEPFAGQCVLIVGAGASGQDLALDLAQEASKVVISAREDKQISCPLPDNVELRLALSSVEEDGRVRFEDDTCLHVDAIVWCTGYAFSYPFLAAECGVSVELGRRVRPLYKHLFHCMYPTMVFMGIPYLIAPFPLFDRQAQLTAAVLEGRVHLPDAETMLEWEQKDYASRLELGFKPHYAHVLGEKQWPYNSDLAAMAGIDDLPPFMEQLYHHVHSRRRTTLANYRHEEYRITSNDDFEIISLQDHETHAQ